MRTLAILHIMDLHYNNQSAETVGEKKRLSSSERCRALPAIAGGKGTASKIGRNLTIRQFLNHYATESRKLDTSRK